MAQAAAPRLTDVFAATYNGAPVAARIPPVGIGYSQPRQESAMSPTTTNVSRPEAMSRRCTTGRIQRSRQSRSAPARTRRTRSAIRDRRTLGSYHDWRGRPREIVSLPGAGKSVLVLDRDAITLGDRRLLAHLAADEPPENAMVVSRCFLRQARRARCACRLLSASDLRTIPFADESEPNDAQPGGPVERTLQDDVGRRYRIERIAAAGMSIPELRWCRCHHREPVHARESVSVRETIAALERYEPVLELTRRAVAANAQTGEVSIVVLRAELVRMQESPIVLNRALRAAVVHAVGRGGQSMSEIAMRCGRIKHDSAGNVSGETSWLARRLGLLPEGGRRQPTPWIHSDVLALIARDGLGLSPREVEAD
jgi:hypothetical protein